MEELTVASRLTPNPTSSSQSLSSARKRHFQEVDQKGGQDSCNDYDGSIIEDEHSDALPNPKRSRPSPRTSNVSLQEFGSVSGTGRRRHGQTTSSASSQTCIQSRRSSRFIEGSMRDRASDCPPDDFTHDESASNRSVSMQHERASEDIYVSYDAGIEPVRPIGIRRFGKTLATALKPTSALQRSSSRSSERPRARVSQEQQRLDDQRTRAEAAYAKLKKNEYPGTRPTLTPHASTLRLNLGESTEYQALLKRNSYADRIGDSVGPGSNRNRPIEHTLKSEQAVRPGSDQNPHVMHDAESEPSVPSSRQDHQVVPSIETITTQNQLLSPPALENSLLSLKKVKSYFRLPNSKSRSLSPSRPAIVSPEKPVDPLKGTFLKESPSKRDLKKQKKLMNKISNLEDKLAHAKRNLRLTLEEAPPIPNLPAAYSRVTEDPASSAMSASTLRTVSAGRPAKFVPGLLPTLPSERLFNPIDRAIHEDLVRAKASINEEEPFKAHSQKNMARATPEWSEPGATLVYQLCPSLSSPTKEASPDDLKAKRSRVDATTVHARRAGSEIEHEDKVHVHLHSFIDHLADRENKALLTSNKGKKKKIQHARASSEGLEKRPTTSLSRMSLSPPVLHKHHQSDSRILCEAATASLDQMCNQGLQVRRDDLRNQVMTPSPQKSHHIPPLPVIPKTMQKGENCKPGGKENRVQQTRLSGVREEEDFTWDEDVF